VVSLPWNRGPLRQEKSGIGCSNQIPIIAAYPIPVAIFFANSSPPTFTHIPIFSNCPLTENSDKTLLFQIFIGR
jgi:hypothetical protein